MNANTFSRFSSKSINLFTSKRTPSKLLQDPFKCCQYFFDKKQTPAKLYVSFSIWRRLIFFPIVPSYSHPPGSALVRTLFQFLSLNPISFVFHRSSKVRSRQQRFYFKYSCMIEYVIGKQGGVFVHVYTCVCIMHVC